MPVKKIKTPKKNQNPQVRVAGFGTSKLTKKELDNLIYLEEIMDEFDRRRIPVYLFALTPTIDENNQKYDGVIQYNNMDLFIRADSQTGTVDLKSLRTMHLMHRGLGYHITAIFSNLKEVLPTSLDEAVDLASYASRTICEYFLSVLTRKDSMLDELDRSISEGSQRPKGAQKY